MKVIIPLAGKGTRLRPHTHLTPKPLMQVAGQPVINYILDQLTQFDVEEIIFITGHLREQIESYIKTHYPNFKSRFIEQEDQNGTAGAVGLAELYVESDVLIIFVDTLFEADLSSVKSLSPGTSGLIWVKEVEEYEHFGVVVTDNDGMMNRIVEKPKEAISRLANIGLYYIRDSKLLFDGIRHVLKQNPGPRGEYFLTDALQYMVDKGAKIKVEEVSAWYDCGQMQTLIDTNRYLLNSGRARTPKLREGVIINEPVYVAEDVELSEVELGPNVTIASGCVIQKSKIRDSIIGERTTVEAAELHSSLIGNDVVIKGIQGSLSVTDHSEIVGA